MKRFVLVITTLLFFSMTGQAFADNLSNATSEINIHGTKNVVKKRAVWKTAHFLNNDWIIVTYNEVK